MKKKRLLKTMAVILLCVVMDIALHVLTSAFSTMPQNPNYSKFAQLFGAEITAALWALLAFSGAAFVFYRIQSDIPGAGIVKGLRYGASISLLWLFAMLEGVGLFGNAIRNEFVVGLSDAIPAFILGLLLSLTIDRKKEIPQSKQLAFRQKSLTVCVITGAFFAGRYLAYYTGAIQSGYQTNPLYTLLWTLLMGVCIGTVCILLGDAGNALPLKRRAAKFGFLVFGVNWAAFLVFMPFLFSGFITDVLCRVVIDTLLVTTGYYLAFSAKAARSIEDPQGGSFAQIP